MRAWQVAFLVSAVFHPDPMASFFRERWGEVEGRLRRPGCQYERGKLERRLAMYCRWGLTAAVHCRLLCCSERWCRREGDWLVRVHNTNTPTKL